MDNRYNVSDGDYECNHKNEDFGLRDSNPIKMYGEKKQKKLPKKNARNDVWKVRDEGRKASYQEQLDAFRRQNGINVPTSSTNKNSYGTVAKIVRYYCKNLSCNIYFFFHNNHFKSSISVTSYKTKKCSRKL